MANPPTQEPGISTIGAAKELGQPDVAWGRGAHPTFSTDIQAQQSRLLQLISIALNNTATTATANPSGYSPVTNGTIFCRPNMESHLFLTSHWIFSVAAGNPGPSTSLTISLQTWLNGYHVLISPSGYANDWSIVVDPIAAGQSRQWTETFMGLIPNLEFRSSPQSHLVQFMYQISSIPANWGTIQFYPRLTIIEGISTSQVNFTKV